MSIVRSAWFHVRRLGKFLSGRLAEGQQAYQHPGGYLDPPRRQSRRTPLAHGGTHGHRYRHRVAAALASNLGRTTSDVLQSVEYAAEQYLNNSP
jgi:hypothetical protein